MNSVLPIADRSTTPPRLAATYSIATRIAIASVVGMSILAILILRLWALTIMSGDQYVKKANNNTVRRIAVEAPRGPILDRNGKAMVTNTPAEEVIVEIRLVKKSQVVMLGTEIGRILGEPRTGIIRKIRAGMSDPLTPVVVNTKPVSTAVMAYIAEHNATLPGVAVRGRSERKYVHQGVGAQLFGQVGEVSAEQLKGKYANLKPGDRIGQSGLENVYDSYLRGVDGYRTIEVDAGGVFQGVGRGVPVTPGRSLRLTIDLDLQKKTELALQEGIEIARKSGSKAADAGAAVAIDPRNGEVLSLASFPTYDPNVFVTPGNDATIKRLLNDKRTPLSNRAIGGLYPPGSIFKPVTAIAALEEGFIKPDTLIGCPAFMEVAGTKFRNWYDEGIGSIQLSTALEVSCDTYFYALALNFYNMPGSRLQDWTRKFGLGTETGVDLPGEQAGLIPTPSWRQTTYKGWDSVWSPGHSVNLSIGQGDLLVTPIQMTLLYAAIANGGTLHQPRIGRSVEDGSGKHLYAIPRGEKKNIGFNKAFLRPIRDGLYKAAHSNLGTSSAVFATFPIPVSGKTGTAEKPPKGDMAWYCGYAPAEAPTIAACAIIEAGGHGGTAAAPVVLRMMQQYFHVGGGSVETNKESD